MCGCKEASIYSLCTTRSEVLEIFHVRVVVASLFELPAALADELRLFAALEVNVAD